MSSGTRDLTTVIARAAAHTQAEIRLPAVQCEEGRFDRIALDRGVQRLLSSHPELETAVSGLLLRHCGKPFAGVQVTTIRIGPIFVGDHGVPFVAHLNEATLDPRV